MNARLTRRALRMAAIKVLLMAAIAANACLLCGCFNVNISMPFSASTFAAKSPKEQVLAGLLMAMNLEGKPVLIEFGMVGCSLSDQGLDDMIALKKSNAVPGMAFVRVEASTDDAAVEKYFKSKAMDFPLYRDKDTALAKDLSATAYPTFVLVDKFGHIRYQGKYPKEQITQWGTTLVTETRDLGSDAPQFGAKAVDTEKLLSATLPDLNDEAKPLAQYMGKHGLVLLFVDTSCPFCALAMKELPDVVAALDKQQIEVLVVNNDDSKDRVHAFYDKNPPAAPVVYDVGAATREQWNIHSVPIAVYITPAKKIGYQGEAAWANMGAAIEKSLVLPAGTIKFTSAGTSYG